MVCLAPVLGAPALLAPVAAGLTLVGISVRCCMCELYENESFDLCEASEKRMY